VLGCGPAGLISAYAAQREFNADVIVLSVKRKSDLFGCQYLHWPLPGISDDRAGMKVEYRLRGTEEEYRRKVYGSYTPPVSPQQYIGDHMAWDLRYAYDRLWEMFEDRVYHYQISPNNLLEVMQEADGGVVVSSLPAMAICQMGDEHTFTSVRSFALGDSPEQKVPYYADPFTITCDGTEDMGWYRLSNVFGYSTVEWPGHKKRPPITGVASFEKPLTTNCECLPSVLRVGRYGRWAKGVLSHTAYDATVNRLRALESAA
jgi:hypothetical protein